MDSALSAIEERFDRRTARGLALAVSSAIAEGALAAGGRLPPIRIVAAAMHISPTSVSSAWSQLAQSGAIVTDGRRGTRIADLGRPVANRYQRAMEHHSNFTLDLSTGIPAASLLPNLKQALEQLTTAGTPSSYLDPTTLPELERVLRAGWPYSVECITVVDGAMDALDLIARSALRLGSSVVVEHPTFPPLVDLLDAVGVQLVGVPMDEHGLSLPHLAEAIRSPVAAVFLQPRAQNPTGISMTPDRAHRIAELLRGGSTLVVEDDSAGAICTTPQLSLGTWIPNQTVHVRSFSKSHGPDLRLAAIGGPAEVLGQIETRRQLGQGWSSRLLQRILHSLLTDDTVNSEITRARDEYARRRTVIVAELARNGVPVGGTDGFNVWVPVADEMAAVMTMASHGIGVTPGAPFAVLPEQHGHLRVTVGLVADHHATLADQLASAAASQGWGRREP